ncbi:hypothetical protein [Halorussus sp. MSC15.2]|uniref:hypothetical protein n=1 Tax=Halorussus sp. MSC15.2 TaxID=2283638 RepID=UPI0013D5BAAC|nr:hypothetical protein [Halorussus sp. MSC15.2]NEU57628.1 hypothetical protein [Halorussus sp. MSC15.2]
MSIEDRLRGDPEPVSESEVMRYWLREELDEEDGGPDPDALDTDPALREELFERKPIAERVFAPERADWYHADLSEEALRDLRVVVGPHDEGWRALTDDNRIESIARRIYESEDAAALDEETPKDLREVVELADSIDAEGPQSRLIVVAESDDPPYVADGNHRAVAHVLHLLRGGDFEGQEAYLGVRENGY